MDEDVVVDAEVGVVEVLVLAADLNGAAVGQQRQRLAEPVRAPDRILKSGAGEFPILGVQTEADGLRNSWADLEPVTSPVRRDAAADHCLPERNSHPFRVFHTEPALNVR